MKFCKTCGGPLKENQRICAKCGSKVKSSSTIINSVKVNLDSEKVSETLNQGKDLAGKTAITAKNIFSSTLSNLKKFAEEKQLKEKSLELIKSKYFKVAITILLVLFICIGGFSLYTKKANSASSFVAKLERTIRNQDYSSLSEMVVFTDNLTQSDLEPFVKYLSENDETLTQLVSHLTKQSELLDSNESLRFANTSTNSNLITLKRETYKNDKYKITAVIHPGTITVDLPNELCKVYINDKEVENVTFNSAGYLEIKNLIPGKYTIKATFKNDLVDLEESTTVNLFDKLTNRVKLIKDNFTSVKLYTNADKATLFVNDVEVQSFSSGNSFGPLVDGMKLHAIIKEGSKEFKSNEVVWNGTKNIHLNFDSSMQKDPIFKTDAAIKEEVTTLLKDYLKDFALAVNRNSYSTISSHILPNSPLETQQRSTIQSLYTQNISEKFVDFELLDLSISEDKSEIIAKVYEVYDITKDNITKTKTFNTKYKINYNPINNKYSLSEYLPVE